MNITVHTLAYNEDLLMQFMIDHWRSRFPNCHIVIYDNNSTDNTVPIAKQNDCEVREYNPNNNLDDGLHAQIKSNCWKNAQTDWVVVCDLDEMLDITPEELEYEESLGTTIFKAEAWTIVNKVDNYDFESMTHGIRDGGYDKNVLFNKKHISEMNYSVGCHSANPVGTVKFSSRPYTLHHFRDVNVERAISRAKATAARLSSANRQHGWGVWQCQRSEAELRADYARLRALIIEVPTRRLFKKEQ